MTKDNALEELARKFSKKRKPGDKITHGEVGERSNSVLGYAGLVTVYQKFMEDKDASTLIRRLDRLEFDAVDFREFLHDVRHYNLNPFTLGDHTHMRYFLNEMLGALLTWQPDDEPLVLDLSDLPNTEVFNWSIVRDYHLVLRGYISQSIRDSLGIKSIVCRAPTDEATGDLCEATIKDGEFTRKPL